MIKRMFIIFLRERMLLGGGFNVCQMFTPKMGKLIDQIWQICFHFG